MSTGLDLAKIEGDKGKYEAEEFSFHCIYVNQHPETIISSKKFDKFLELCDESWFHYVGEDVRDKAGRMVYRDRRGILVKHFPENLSP